MATLTVVDDEGLPVVGALIEVKHRGFWFLTTQSQHTTNYAGKAVIKPQAGVMHVSVYEPADWNPLTKELGTTFDWPVNALTGAIPQHREVKLVASAKHSRFASSDKLGTLAVILAAVLAITPAGQSIIKTGLNTTGKLVDSAGSAVTGLQERIRDR